MATPQADLRVLLNLSSDADVTPETRFDSHAAPQGPFLLSGYSVKQLTTLVLTPDADDQALSVADACGLLLVSDQPFSLRLAALETLVPHLRCFLVWQDSVSENDPAIVTSVLLTGNAANECTIEVFKIEVAA